MRITYFLIVTVFASVTLSEPSAMNRIGFLKICTQAKMTGLFYKRSVPFFAVTHLHEFWKGTERKPGGIEIGLKYAGIKLGFHCVLKV